MSHASALLPTIWSNVQDGVTAASSGDTVNVAAGTYAVSSQIVINKNLSIVGTNGKDNTDLNIGFDTSNSGDSKGWFLVTDGTTFNLSGVTLDGTGHKVFQAIRDMGSGTIDAVAFKNIGYNPSGPDYAGTAVVVFGSASNVTVENSTFSGIGREGVLFYGSGTTGTFTGNTYTGKGLGNWLDYAVEVGAGAHANIGGTDPGDANTITGNTGVASVDGSISAGIIVTTYYGDGTQATIIGNTIYGNTAGVGVGYDGSDTATAIITGNTFFSGTTGNDVGIAVSSASAKIQSNDLRHNTVGIEADEGATVDAGGGTLGSTGGNSFSGNSSYGVNNLSSTGVYATGNWWGDASGPSGVGSGTGAAVSANVTYDPWVGKTTSGLDTANTATVAPTISASLLEQIVESVASTPEGQTPDVVTTTVTTDNVNNFVTLVKGLPDQAAQAAPVTIVMNLDSGDYTGGLNLDIPAGVTLVINGTSGTVILHGGCPALIVNSGDVEMTNVTFDTVDQGPPIADTDANTIEVNGGSLKLRGCTVIETSNGTEAGIKVTGGTVDLGTSADLGNNIFDINGSGQFINNTGNATVSAIGNTWEQDGARSPITSPSRMILPTRWIIPTTGWLRGWRITFM